MVTLLPLPLSLLVENCSTPHISGRCISMTPVGDQTQLSSGWLGTLIYAPLVTVTCHSTREKLMRHCSPSEGGPAWRARSERTFHGNASSTVQPWSVSPV